jgi:hypothetical protein
MVSRAYELLNELSTWTDGYYWDVAEKHIEELGRYIYGLEAENKRLREALDNIADGLIPGVDYDQTRERLDNLMSGYARHVLKALEGE